MNHSLLSAQSVCPLSHLALWHITGADTLDFMQSQLTSSVNDLTENQAVLAGFCQAKGRLQATMLVWRDPQQPAHLYVMIDRSIEEQVRKRLSMFVLRAKVNITPIHTKVYGALLPDSPGFQLPQAHYAVRHEQALTWIAAPNASEQSARAWVIDWDNQIQAAELSPAHWAAADIYAGLPWVQAPIYETFLPQDINLDIIGGVNFKKGCFPGQEVVARLHYRTTAKRRAALGTLAVDAQSDIRAGMDIFACDDLERPCGRIINAAYDPQAQCWALLMEVHIEQIQTQSICLASAPQTAITVQTLPYGWEIAKY